MKKKNIITTSTLSLATVALVAGFAFSAYAQDSATALETTTHRGQQRNFSLNLTTEQRAEMEAKRVEMEAERATRQAAMQTAINSGNYDSWVQTVKTQMGEDAVILTKVTADNFSQFVEAHQLMAQAQEKFKAMGLKGGMGADKGHGRGFGRHLQPEASADVK